MQTYSSKNTSINQTARLYKWVAKRFKPCTVLDYGAGKFHCGKQYLEKFGFVVDEYEPNNGDVLTFEKTYDLVLISNVLNVIDDDNAIWNIIVDCAQLTDDGLSGQTFATVYEGDCSGIGKATKKDCYQRNQRSKDYEEFMFDLLPNKILKLEIGH